MKSLKVNRIVKYMVLSDLVFWLGWGLIGPVFAIFILDHIEGGNAMIVGFATAVYWVTKSVLRVPIGMLLDAHKGEKDDYWFMTGGLFMASLVPFGYVYATQPVHLYLLEVVHAIAMAMSLSGWSAIFSRHLDKGSEATEFGLDATSVGLGTGISAALGGWAVTHFTFQQVFIATGFFGLVGAFLLLFLREDVEAAIVLSFKSPFGFMKKIKKVFVREKIIK
jgi:predicted MFS family arabinose efflux permease